MVHICPLEGSTCTQSVPTAACWNGSCMRVGRRLATKIECASGITSRLCSASFRRAFKDSQRAHYQFIAADAGEKPGLNTENWVDFNLLRLFVTVAVNHKSIAHAFVSSDEQCFSTKLKASCIGRNWACGLQPLNISFYLRGSRTYRRMFPMA